MEVLPFSGVCYAGESDCCQQASGTTYMYCGESNSIAHADKVLQADIKVNNTEINMEGPPVEIEGGGQWSFEGFPTPVGNLNGERYYGFDMDSQKNLHDSHDTGGKNMDGHDHPARSGLVSENSSLSINATGSTLLTNNQQGESVLLQSKWLEQDEPLPVWVKWRGKWQAGIKCARADWPLSTLKAKPTHDRKKYVVIFFPRTRNYSWADVLLVCAIDEFPQPIAYKTHKAGAKTVKDLTIAHRFIMQRLAVSMINILDQLHNEALIDTARSVMIWKEFAMEASRCKGYSDLGRTLLKLQNMITSSYIKPHWLQNSLQSWVQRCQNADCAELVETLKEELSEAILWDEVNSLPNGATQPELGPDWRTWKQEVMKWFSLSNPVSNGEDMEQLTGDNSATMDDQLSRKRPKLEVRRAETHTSLVENQNSNQTAIVEVDTGFFSGHDVANTAPVDSQTPKDELSLVVDSQTSKDELSLVDSDRTGPAPNISDRWDEIIVETRGSEHGPTKEMDSTPTSEVSQSMGRENKYRRCIAFIESKGRQCVRYANEGDVYCCIHLASRFTSNPGKAEATTPVDSPMCEGTTVLGTKCKHRSLRGSSFCKKHRPRDEKTFASGSHENKLKRKHEESDTIYSKVVQVGEVETPFIKLPTLVMHADISNKKTSTEVPEKHQVESGSSEMAHCIGLWSQGACDTCTESPKRHSLYCEKHLPNWLKRARNGKSRVISKEVFIELLKDCRSREQKLQLHQACELFYRLFKSILSLRNQVPKEVQYQWAITEASRDVRVGEYLLKLVNREKERLKKLWGFKDDESTDTYPYASDFVPNPVLNESDGDEEGQTKCKICSEKLPGDQALGKHWIDNHKKEAQWLFRGYACAICLDSFTNKKVLEAHVQERHHVQFVDQCMLFQCIPCGNHFGNPDELWLHVVSVHSANLQLSNVAQQHSMSTGEASWKKPEQGKAPTSGNVNSEGQSDSRRYVCRFCGLKFDLLPDLGRHHQAAHMNQNSVGPRLQKKGVAFYNYKLKSGRLSHPKFKKGLGSVSLRIRNRNARTLKKHTQEASLVGGQQTETQPHGTDAASLGRLADPQCSAIAQMLFSEIEKTIPRPNNLDILSIARSACCKVSLQATLEAKYGLVPERVYLRAAKLCSEHNILVEWHQEGFICPRGCRPRALQILSTLVPLPDDLIRPGSSVLCKPPTSQWTMDECHHVIDSRYFSQETGESSIVLCDDISFGQESVPVACVVDENLLGSLHILADDMDGQIASESLPWESFMYLTKPMLDKSLGLEAESSQLGCACGHSTCSPETCDHVYLFDNDYEDARDIFGKPMHGRFPYDERGRIILEEGYLVYECNQRCHCSKTCQNRVLQNGIKVKLEIYKTEKKGWAVRTREAILRGTFICEYIGEVIGEQEANERRNRYGDEGSRYFYEIDARINDMSRLIEGQVPYVIDATKYGNVSRYINHSCSPNLVNHQVLVESMDCQLAHIGLFASRDIAVGEELTYDYRYKLLPGDGCPCLCGASNCKGRLY